MLCCKILLGDFMKVTKDKIFYVRLENEQTKKIETLKKKLKIKNQAAIIRFLIDNSNVVLQHIAEAIK